AVGVSLGKLYGINTLGAVAGIVAASPGLVALVGVNGTIIAGGLLNLGIGAGVLRLAGVRPQRRDAPSVPTEAGDPVPANRPRPAVTPLTPTLWGLLASYG